MGYEAAELVRRVVTGDRRALARAISVVEDGTDGAAEVLAACAAVGRRGRRVGVTGAAGAGKSTLVDRMVRWVRERGETVAVVAVDPTSPYSGGALLGDRIRMQGFTGDAGVMIRSMASRGAVGGVARTAEGVCRVLEAAGFGVVVIETVGVGQDEVAVAGLADVTAVVLVPGMGDYVQSLKAGVMEIADVYVVNKADLPGAERVVEEVEAMQGLAAGEAVRVVKTVAATGDGVEELMEEVMRLAETTAAAGHMSEGAVGAVLEIDHLGVAVRSLVAAKGFYELLGLQVGDEEVVEHEGVRVAMVGVGESRIELLEALGEESVIGRFVARRGEGLHHVALRVSGLEERFQKLQAAGVRLLSDRVRVGAGGHRYFFVHPASTGGVLVELVEG